MQLYIMYKHYLEMDIVDQPVGPLAQFGIATGS